METCHTSGLSASAICGRNLISNQLAWNFLITKLQAFQITSKVKIVQHVLTLNRSWRKVQWNFRSCTRAGTRSEWEIKMLESVIGGDGEKERKDGKKSHPKESLKLFLVSSSRVIEHFVSAVKKIMIILKRFYLKVMRSWHCFRAEKDKFQAYSWPEPEEKLVCAINKATLLQQSLLPGERWRLNKLQNR